MNEASAPGSDRHRGECDHLEAVLTIVMMPALIASGSSGQAATTATKSGSILQMSFGGDSASAGVWRRKGLLDMVLAAEWLRTSNPKVVGSNPTGRAFLATAYDDSGSHQESLAHAPSTSQLWARNKPRTYTANGNA